MLKRFYTAIVRRRKAVLTLFALAAVLCVFAMRQVQVDYDINDYLPPDSPSTTAIEVMNSAFTGGIPNMRVMVRDVTIPEALAYKEQIATIDGVASVTWLDDSLDVTVPLQMQDTDTVETYYKDSCALFTVTVEDAKRLEAVDAVRELIGEDNALAGTAVSTAVATNSTVTEVAKIAAIAVVYVLFILILTTDSWLPHRHRDLCGREGDRRGLRHVRERRPAGASGVRHRCRRLRLPLEQRDGRGSLGQVCLLPQHRSRKSPRQNRTGCARRLPCGTPCVILWHLISINASETVEKINIMSKLHK